MLLLQSSKATVLFLALFHLLTHLLQRNFDATNSVSWIQEQLLLPQVELVLYPRKQTLSSHAIYLAPSAERHYQVLYSSPNEQILEL